MGKRDLCLSVAEAAKSMSSHGRCLLWQTKHRRKRRCHWSARVVVFMGCECKLKSGGREASEYDGTVYVDDVRAHASMRIGTIPHLPHRSNVVTSLSTSQENKFENILYEELPRPHRGPGKYFYNKIIVINIYAQISFWTLHTSLDSEKTMRTGSRATEAVINKERYGDKFN